MRKKISSSGSGWKDSIEMVIGLWLLVSPLALGFFSNPVASISTIAVATVVFFVSQLGLANQQPWEEWVNLIAAVILIVSPWLFGYASVAAATWNALAAGGLLILLTVLQMIEEYGALKAKQTP
ncbi:MAG: SPW repeat protein [Gammaproteobacteria bacterium]|nr:SPW repeat protein [Gammaproteobacteria bacterium]